MENEIWKPVPEFESLYEVSNFGNVRSLDRKVIQKNAFGTYSDVIYKGQLLKFQKAKNGYLYFNARSQTSNKTLKPHRLVAILFVENPHLYLEVNHIDGNKENNNYTNLEWCTPKQNQQHAVNTGLVNNKSGIEGHNVTTKIQIFKDGVLVNECYGEKELNDLGFTSSGVWSCINGKQKFHRKHTFKRIKIK